MLSFFRNERISVAESRDMQTPKAVHSDILLHAEDLEKSFSGTRVVAGISFDLRRGEILGILGPNGAGKTTTVGMLYGFVSPDRGRILLNGVDVQRNPREARRGVGVVTQENNLDRDFSVTDSLYLFAHHFKLRGAAARKRVKEVMESTGLMPHAEKASEQLSGGFQRRFVLARALLNKPDIVFLDEPTTGLDPEARQDFWRLISELKADGVGILLTTHYMDEAERLCDRLILMRDGKQIDQGSPAELIQKIAGAQVYEIEGLSEQSLQHVSEQFGLWHRALGSAFVLSLAAGQEQEIWNRLEALGASRLTKRRSDLQDVFLYLTGTRLSGGTSRHHS
jgi:lipooligosaccharide transport system ATP-binding protein